MPANALVSTTLTAAIDASTQSTLLPVVSNATHTVGQYVLVGGEAMQVQSKIGTTGTLVQRGMLGTRARSAVSGAKVYGSTTTLGPTTYQPFAGEQRVTLPDAAPVGLPLYSGPLGTRARDAVGNEYVLVAFLNTVLPQQPVIINSDFTADVVGVTGRGPMGVIAETGTVTSANWGWVQVYGRCFVMLGMVGFEPSTAAVGPTTLSTSVVTRFQLAITAQLTTPVGLAWTNTACAGNGAYIITGMRVAFDASPATETSYAPCSLTTTGKHIAVFLNYPQIDYAL